MNERIAQLMADASGGACYDGNQLALYGEDIEKFAELIVKECARKVEDMIDNGWYADTEELKKHFGVEE